MSCSVSLPSPVPPSFIQSSPLRVEPDKEGTYPSPAVLLLDIRLPCPGIDSQSPQPLAHKILRRAWTLLCRSSCRTPVADSILIRSGPFFAPRFTSDPARTPSSYGGCRTVDPYTDIRLRSHCGLIAILGPRHSTRQNVAVSPQDNNTLSALSQRGVPRFRLRVEPCSPL